MFGGGFQCGDWVLVLFLFFSLDRTGGDDCQVQPRSARRERKKVGGGVRSEAEDLFCRSVSWRVGSGCVADSRGRKAG